jgi:hypothetical protein
LSENIDRSKVLRFFTWTGRELGLFLSAAGCMAAGNWITYLGVSLALMSAEKAWILGFTASGAAVLLALAAFLVVKALTSDKRLSAWHGALNRVKRHDFERILVNSFGQTGTALSALHDFETGSPPVRQQGAAGLEGGELAGALAGKAVFLHGQRGDSEYLKFYFDGSSLLFEHSPVSVAVLYLTAKELIAYVASADLVRGAVTGEELTRIPLQKVIDASAEPVYSNRGRAGNERLFQEYERVIKSNPSDVVTSVAQSLRIRVAGSEDIVFPASPPDYWHAKRAGAHADENERFARIAGEIARRASEARPEQESGMHPDM